MEVAQRNALNEEFQRIKRLPPYVFNIVNELKAEARARGEDIVDFGMGNPDLPTPPTMSGGGSSARAPTMSAGPLNGQTTNNRQFAPDLNVKWRALQTLVARMSRPHDNLQSHANRVL